MQNFGFVRRLNLRSNDLLLLRHDAAAAKRAGLEGLKNTIIPFYDDLENSWAKLF